MKRYNCSTNAMESKDGNLVLWSDFKELETMYKTLLHDVQKVLESNNPDEKKKFLISHSHILWTKT